MQISVENGFIVLINQHRRLIYKICHLYDDNRDDREDLLQDILLQLWRAFPSFQGEAFISTWVYRMALNTAISWFRKEKRKPGLQGISDAKLQLMVLIPSAMNPAIDTLSP